MAKVLIKINHIGAIPFLNRRGPITTPIPVDENIVNILKAQGFDITILGEKKKVDPEADEAAKAKAKEEQDAAKAKAIKEQEEADEAKANADEKAEIAEKAAAEAAEAKETAEVEQEEADEAAEAVIEEEVEVIEEEVEVKADTKKTTKKKGTPLKKKK